MERPADFWEDQHRLDATSPDGQLGGLGDHDHDGAYKRSRVFSGYQPTRRSRRGPVWVPLVQRTGAQLKLSFRVLKNRRYQVQVSNDLTS
jgi:hypothetical protein